MIYLTVDGNPRDVAEFLGQKDMSVFGGSRKRGELLIDSVKYSYSVQTVQYTGPTISRYYEGNFSHGDQMLQVELILENLLKKEIQESKAKVQQAQRAFKQAKRELSKLQEKTK